MAPKKKRGSSPAERIEKFAPEERREREKRHGPVAPALRGSDPATHHHATAEEPRFLAGRSYTMVGPAKPFCWSIDAPLLCYFQPDELSSVRKDRRRIDQPVAKAMREKPRLLAG